MESTDNVVARLLESKEPSVRYTVLTRVLGKPADSDEIARLRKQIKSSNRVGRLLAGRDRNGRIPLHPYAKWYGAHWVLAVLADLGYPPGDKTLEPLKGQVYEWIFGKRHHPSTKPIAGRARTHASMEGNIVYYLLALGLADERVNELVDRLLQWQWPDGGWNCDPRDEATHSSFTETLIPLHGLSLHAKVAGSRRSKRAAARAADVFLKRKLFLRQSDDRVISQDFVKLHYPCYWHYDILFGLKVLAEAGSLHDDRCHDALDLLESKRLPGGGFPAERKYYQTTTKARFGWSPVDWGPTGGRAMNEFVTTSALVVLKEAGRSV